MAMSLCPAGGVRALESYVGGFLYWDSAVCTSRVLFPQRRHGEFGNGYRLGECGGLRGHSFSSAGNTLSKRTARHVGQKAVFAVQDGSSTEVVSSTQVEEDKLEQTWDTAGGPNTPMVPTNQLVSLQIPSKFN